MPKNCSVSTCERRSGGRGLCAAHYMRWWSTGDVRADVPLRPPAGSVSASERFWSHVDRAGGPDSCWLWTAGCDSHGYGSFRVGRAMVHASRVAYELSHGPLPAGMVVCHICDNPPCCNPAHLWIGTQVENIADRDRKGRTVIRPAIEASIASRRMRAGMAS